MKPARHHHEPRHHAQRRFDDRRDGRSSGGSPILLAFAGVFAVAYATGIGVDEQPGDTVAAEQVGFVSGFGRARAPQAGDSWGGCNDARAAGTAPIYRGEPGYREDMDGDSDGIACEPRY
jgi:hypothetical protein